MHHAVRQKSMVTLEDSPHYAMHARPRRKVMKLMRMLAVTALLASSHLVYGQAETPVMSVNIPFAFTAAGVSMPAGHYAISRSLEGQLWELRSFDRAHIYLTAKPRELRQAPASSLLVFEHDAAGYTLRQIQEKAQTDIAQVVEPSRAKSHKSTGQEVASVRVLGR
jgi:hypothetical protein